MAVGTGKVKSFEDLRIFQEALELTSQIYAVTRQGPIAKDYALVDQMRRSAVSVLSNIAEGFERGTNREFVRALYMAKGSCGELRAQLLVALGQKYLTENEHEKLSVRCRKISAGIFHLIQHLQRSYTARTNPA